MTAESPLPTIDAAALQETMGQICAGHDHLERFLRDVFCNLSGLADEFARQQRLVAADCETREAEFRRREEQLGRQREQLESMFQRTQDLAAQVSAPLAVNPEAAAQFERILSGVEQQRSAIASALETAGSHSSQLSQVVEELAAARRDLAQSRQEILAQREWLERIPPEENGSEAAAMRQRLADLEQQRGAWSQERAVLETELDCVRNRAAELTDALEEERRRVAEERKGWAEELRRMRRLLETLADRPSPPATPRGGMPPVQASPAIAGSRLSEEADSANDPVLDSVMAQFEILQKDLARRRKARPIVQLSSEKVGHA